MYTAGLQLNRYMSPQAFWTLFELFLLCQLPELSLLAMKARRSCKVAHATTSSPAYQHRAPLRVRLCPPQVVCPDCRKGKPCDICDGRCAPKGPLSLAWDGFWVLTDGTCPLTALLLHRSCVVCTGAVPPGPTSLELGAEWRRFGEDTMVPERQRPPTPPRRLLLAGRSPNVGAVHVDLYTVSRWCNVMRRMGFTVRLCDYFCQGARHGADLDYQAQLRNQGFNVEPQFFSGLNRDRAEDIEAGWRAEGRRRHALENPAGNQRYSPAAPCAFPPQIRVAIVSSGRIDSDLTNQLLDPHSSLIPS
jgi:hypothetical protein